MACYAIACKNLRFEARKRKDICIISQKQSGKKYHLPQHFWQKASKFVSPISLSSWSHTLSSNFGIFLNHWC